MVKKLTMAAGVAVIALGFALPVLAEDCNLTYTRIACAGKEADSYKKCDGKPSCTQAKPAASKQECLDLAKKACDNDRTDITKYKGITAAFGAEKLVGGFTADGKTDATGPNFCANDRPDMNKCQ
ncbi:MAG: hypothetical protein HQL58_03940 [Magnetococcales bacterium]|nr:hypothetical protein [Magnetococcales bacterium]